MRNAAWIVHDARQVYYTHLPIPVWGASYGNAGMGVLEKLLPYQKMTWEGHL